MSFDFLKEKVLKKSDSYQHYKNFHDENKNNQDSNDKIDELKKLIYKNNLYNQEILYAHRFNDTIKGSKWLTKQNFSLNKSSASYSFLYVLYRVLDEANPKNILELGLGQTSKLTSQYANFFNLKVKIIESDKEWINLFSKNLDTSDNLELIQIDTDEYNFNSTKSLKYKDFSNKISNDKFDLIIIDGPYGYDQSYPRSNILNLLDNLSEEFIIIVDDYERLGEKNTVNELFKALDKKKINYNKVEFEGTKKQLAIFTRKYKFVAWF
ncbi:hypothetical protein [Methanobrevibacter sp. DSM 116169]|uniref:hypothetical protein n=1 Tax=Methanobrevibacter sp. DSM 116169 TaxID=3242727 RepID=UPI0038FCD70E